MPARGWDDARTGGFGVMDRSSISEMESSARTAATAELAYLDGEGRVRARPVTPLVLDGNPAFTLACSDAALAEELRRSPEACLVFSDSRLALVGWKPLAARVRLEMTPDLEGELFREELLTEELRKYPPDRKLLDSMMLRRENWWYMPRFIFRAADEIGELHPVEKRTSPNHSVLAWGDGDGGVSADTVEVEDWEGEKISTKSLAGRNLPASNNAALLRHDFTVPDMEQRTSFLAVGTMNNGRFSLGGSEGERELGSPPGLIRRWREFRNLRKRCIAAIAKHENSP